MSMPLDNCKKLKLFYAHSFWYSCNYIILQETEIALCLCFLIFM
jgi:hypothetical protein